jgi:hypothetical protein
MDVTVLPVDLAQRRDCAGLRLTPIIPFDQPVNEVCLFSHDGSV